MFRLHCLGVILLVPMVVSARPVPAAPAKRQVTAPRKALPQPPREAACRRAVQEFYDWYLPRLMREVRVTAREQALNARPQNFSAELHRGLAEDLAAAKKNPDEIVGLDFEPLVNSQDPAAKYVAKKVSRAGKGYRVEVHAVVDGKASEHPDVIAEVVLQKGHWTFVNFHYPSEDAKEPGTDLLKLLRQLKEDRRKQKQ